MSTTIDQRVVEMQFDNKHFERNVATSMSTLDKLKKSLDLRGASKGLEDVGAAAKKCDVSVVGEAAEKVGLKFNAMYTIADQALRNITNSAMNAGKRIVSALTIDPIKTGFQEYETQINAIQTILANTESKGTTLEDVNGALDELNTYADKTIYNFTEMTRNIGTFTAAGVDLDTSVSAIKGIANLAAVSGSNSHQASTAMYQLSQALASGTVKLMDWNSVVNAGMGGQVFQDALKETARVHGVAIDDIIKKNGSFRESLSEGWLTSEILTDTLAKFTGDLSEEQLKAQGYTEKQIEGIMKLGKTANDAATKVKTFSQLFETLKEAAQSGWTQTWEILVGDFEEAKELLTTISDVVGGFINQMSESRNELLENWKVMGGRQDLIDSFKNIFEGLVSVIKPIRDAFREIFPPATAEQLFNITKGLKEFTAKLKLSRKGSENLKRTFKGLFSVLSLVGDIIKAVFKAVGTLFGGVGDLGGGILEVTAVIGDWLSMLSEAIRYGDIFGIVFGGIGKVFGFVIKVIGGLVKGFASLLDGMSVTEKVVNAIQTSVGEAGSALASWGIVEVLVGVWKVIKTIGSGIVKVFGGIVDWFKSAFSEGGLANIMELIKGLLSGGLLLSIINFVKGLSAPLSEIKDFISDFSGGITGVLDDFRGCLQAYQTNLKAEALKNLAVAIAILVASLVLLSSVDTSKLTDAIIALGLLFAELTIAMAAFSKTFGGIDGASKNPFTELVNFAKSMIQMSVAASVMKSMATAILILAVALRVIGGLNWEELAVGLVGVAGLAAILVATSKILGSGGTTAIKGALQMVIFAAAITILASVCETLSYFSWEELAKGLIGVGVLLGAVALFMNTAKFSGKSITTATGIVILAAAIKVLASACKDFAYMEWGEIGKGLATVGVLLAELAIFTNLTGNAKHVVSTGIAMIAIAAAMKIFVSAVKDMASMSWGDLGKGLLGMAGALTMLTIALNLMPKGMISKGLGLIAVASALTILYSVLSKMGNMSWESIGKGLLTLGGSLLILAAGLHAMKGTLGGSAALLVAVTALLLLIPVLTILGGMSWSSIAKGLLVIAGAFTVLGVAALLLKPLVVTILALSGAFALMGVGMLAAGAGMVIFAAGVSALAVAVVALIGGIAVGLTTLVDAIMGSLDSIVVGVVEIVGAFIMGILLGVVNGLGDVIVALCRVVIDSAGAIGEALIALVVECCNVLVECAPVIADSLLKVVALVLESLVEYTPRIVDSLFKFIIAIIDGVASNMPALIQAVVNLFMSIFQGAVDALGSIDPTALIQGIAAIGLMAGLVAALAAIVPMIPSAMVGVVGLGVVIAELALVLAAIGALAQIPGLTWLVSEGGNFLEAIGTAIGQFIGGIIGGVAQGITSSFPQIGSDLSLFMTNLQPFIEGAKGIDSSVLEGVKSIVGVILAITAANVIQGLTSWITGGASISTFAAELPALGAGIKAFSDSVTGISPESILAAVDAAKALAEMTNCIPNSGGVVSWFTGENSISKFASELPALGKGLKGFSDAVTGVSPEVITAAANAAKTLAEMTNLIPNSGGVVSWFAGDNSISKWSEELVKLGEGLSGFSKALVGVNPETIVAASNAAKTLAEMTQNIPNEGGVASWFAGENSVSKFSEDLVSLGKGLKGFSDEIAGVNPETVSAAATAAQSLAQLTTYLPNEGGVVSWFTGESSLSKFSGDIVLLGQGLKGFSDATVGVNPETMTAAASAAKALAEMTSYIPNEGGIVSWFTGESSISSFADKLPALGNGLKGFSDATAGVNPETMTAAANAAKSLAEMTTHIPNEGGIAAWFTGESSIANFASKLPELGEGLKGFSSSIEGINAENVSAAANAAKALAEMTAHIPNEGGIAAWFTGESSISNFADKLPALGKGLKGFSTSVAGINPENVTAAANAAKSLAQMAETAPKDSSKIVAFGENLVKFGTKLASYFKSTSGISADSTSASTKAIDAVKQASAIDSGKLTSVSTGIDKVAKALKGLSSVPKDCASSFTKALKELGEKSSDAFVKAFDSLGDDLKKKAKSAMDAFVEGIEGKKSTATKACKTIATACSDALKDKRSSFESAGKSLAQGFADGISANTFKAEAKAKAMAEAAEKAAKEALDINSPSRVFMGIGEGIPEGMVIGIDNLSNAVRGSVESMTDSSIDGVKNSISRIADIVNSDIDAQPTIRPVLDLSDVQNGANAINNMLGSNSLDVLANVGAISSIMDRKNQNGANEDVVSAIDKLNKNLENGVGDTYNFGDIAYDDGSAIAEAVKALVRAAIQERRV